MPLFRVSEAAVSRGRNDLNIGKFAAKEFIVHVIHRRFNRLAILLPYDSHPANWDNWPLRMWAGETRRRAREPQ
jgi:hypothetical protein